MQKIKPDTELRKRFAENLRKRRAELPPELGKDNRKHPVGQAKLAKRMGVSARQYQHWEAGTEGATLDSIALVAAYYKVSVGALCR